MLRMRAANRINGGVAVAYQPLVASDHAAALAIRRDAVTLKQGGVEVLRAGVRQFGP